MTGVDRIDVIRPGHRPDLLLIATATPPTNAHNPKVTDNVAPRLKIDPDLHKRPASTNRPAAPPPEPEVPMDNSEALPGSPGKGL